jgi:hypothetical protein
MYNKIMARGKENDRVMSAEYIVGFTDGEGCFYVQIRKDFRIVLRYFITQRYDNKEVLEDIQTFFGVGYVHLKKQEWGHEYRRFRRPSYVFEVTKQNDIQQVIVPFFRKYPLQGVKRFSFEKFAIIANLVKGRQDTRLLSKKELTFVSKLKKTMNTLNRSGSPDAGNPHVRWERE